MEYIFDEDVDEVGSDAEAYCPKCRADTAHVIVAKYEDEIRRVQCNPCGDVHAFRKPKGEAEEDAATEPKKRAAKAKPTWEQMMAKAKKEPRLYMVADRYGDNELISHPKFGVGFVSDVIGNDKIEVTFQNEKRVLVHNRKGMSLPPAAYAHAVDATLPSTKRERRKAKLKTAVARAAAVRASHSPAKPSHKPAKLQAKQPAVRRPERRRPTPLVRPNRAKPKARAAAPARAKRRPVRTTASKKLRKR